MQKVNVLICCSALLLATSLLTSAKGASSDERTTASALSSPASPIEHGLSDLHLAQIESAHIVLPSAAELQAGLVHVNSHPITTTWTAPQEGLTQAEVNAILKQAADNAIGAAAVAAGERFNTLHPGYALGTAYYAGQVATFVGMNAAMGQLTSAAKGLFTSARSASNAANEAATNDAEASSEVNSEINAAEATNAEADDPADILAEGEASDGLYAGEEAEAGDAAGEAANDAADVGLDE